MKNRILSIFAVLFSIFPLGLFAQEDDEPPFVPPDEDEGHNGLPYGRAPIDEPMFWLVLAAVVLGVAFLYYRRQRINRA